VSAKKVLFINHDALPAGAPLFLLNFLRWLRGNSGIRFRILLKNSGELEHEFRTLGQVNVFSGTQPRGTGLAGRAARLVGIPALRERMHYANLMKELRKDDIGLIYSNTITNGAVLAFLAGLNCPVITHVHELEYWIYRTGADNFAHIKNCTSQYIAVSDAVKQNLMHTHGIPEKKIDVIHGFIPLSDLKFRSHGIADLRTSLKIPNDALIVGGSGYETWRKGRDLFVQLARDVSRKYHDRAIHFVWIGGRPEGTACYEIMHDVLHAGVSDRVHFVDHVSNPLEYYREFDMFAMISREDPFPLVNLEVAALGKPIVCFENAGGTPEFVEKDAGFVVPYLDIPAMADKIITLAKDDELRKKIGRRSFEKVTGQYDISAGGQRLLEVMERFL
jgi:glycosyltransferase involved in cell wall biosynthesis